MKGINPYLGDGAKEDGRYTCREDGRRREAWGVQRKRSNGFCRQLSAGFNDLVPAVVMT